MAEKDVQSIELVKRIQGGDLEAFSDIYELYSDSIYRYVNFKVQNSDEIDDIFQEIFVKVWKAVPKLKTENLKLMLGYTPLLLMRLMISLEKDTELNLKSI